jgi:metal-responsive CopG/Arc/MetJ family transcriptional regulator
MPEDDGEKKTVSVYVEEELVEEFDDKMWNLKANEEIGRDTSRSQMIAQLMEEWVEGKSNSAAKTAIVAD